MSYKEKIPAAYILTHDASKKEYIGSTGHIKQRINEHLSRLNKSKHHITELQELFNKDKKITIEFLPTNTREEAYDLEQKLLDERKEKQLLNKGFNSRTSIGIIPSDQTKNKMGESHKGFKHSEKTKQLMSEKATGKKFTEEHKENIKNAQKLLANTKEGKERLLKNSMLTAQSITIDNINYESIREASRKLNLNRQTIKRLYIK